MGRPTGTIALIGLHRAMVEKEMTVLSLAQAVGKSPSLIYQILSGAKQPSLRTALRISDVLERDVKELFG